MTGERGPIGARLVLLSLFLAAAGCASAGESGEGVADPGCYQFRWDAGARALGLPWGFELTERPLDEWPNLEGARIAVTRLRENATADHPFGFWRPAAGDSITLGHPGGGGFSLTLGPDGQDWTGYGYAAGDAMVGGQPPDRTRHPVTALRVLCPDPAG